jgi:hypothetical protein
MSAVADSLSIHQADAMADLVYFIRNKSYRRFVYEAAHEKRTKTPTTFCHGGDGS